MTNMNAFDINGLVSKLIRGRVRKFTLGSIYSNGGLLIITAFGVTACGGGGGGGGGSTAPRASAPPPPPLNFITLEGSTFTTFAAADRSGAFDVIDTRELNIATTVNLDTDQGGATGVTIDITGFEGYYGGAGADIITLDSDSVSYVNGGGGNDIINIVAGTTWTHSKVDGGAGNDTFNIGGGDGHILAGGAGADTFSFTSASAGTTIMGFVSGEDELDFSGLTDVSYVIDANGVITILHGADGARGMFIITASGAVAGDIMGAVLLDVEQFFRQALADGVIYIVETDGNLVLGSANGDTITYDRQAGAYNSDTNSDGDISLDEFIEAVLNGSTSVDEFFETVSANLSFNDELILDFRRAIAEGLVSIAETDGNLVFNFANGDITTYDRQAGAFNADVNLDGNISFDEFADAIANLGF